MKRFKPRSLSLLELSAREVRDALGDSLDSEDVKTTPLFLVLSLQNRKEFVGLYFFLPPCPPRRSEMRNSYIFLFLFLIPPLPA
jgi:hypothetical protein